MSEHSDERWITVYERGGMRVRTDHPRRPMSASFTRKAAIEHRVSVDAWAQPLGLPPGVWLYDRTEERDGRLVVVLGQCDFDETKENDDE